MITTLDKHTALVLIDLQKGIVKNELAHPIKEIVENAVKLVNAFRKVNLSIVLVNVIPSGNWQTARKDSGAMSNATTPSADFADIVDDIQKAPTDILITKGTWNAFYNTSLQNELQKRNITGIVLGGISTSIGVEGTARAASELGYNITFATDAMTDRLLEAHQNSIKHIFPRLGEVGATADIIAKIK